jgi:hypothetical protein
MVEKDVAVCTPRLRAEDKDMPWLPWVDSENFNPGYLMRSLHLMPKQGDRDPWTFSQDYHLEKDELPADKFDNGALVFEGSNANEFSNSSVS